MDWIVILSAGFFGGMLNAVAGGGSFLTLPALIFVGVSPVSANATGTAALLPGYIASVWRFRNDLKIPSNLSFFSISIIAILGGGIGAIALLKAGDKIFSNLVPWLILMATIAFILGPHLVWKTTQHQKTSENEQESTLFRKLTIATALLIVCIYGGYFNGGLGIILLASLGLMGKNNLLHMNGIKNLMSALLTTVAVFVYALGGSISIEHLMLLSVAAIVGGYFGAEVAYRISPILLRNFITCVGVILSAVFFSKSSL